MHSVPEWIHIFAKTTPMVKKKTPTLKKIPS